MEKTVSRNEKKYTIQKIINYNKTTRILDKLMFEKPLGLAL